MTFFILFSSLTTLLAAMSIVAWVDDCLSSTLVLLLQQLGSLLQFQVKWMLHHLWKN